MTLGLTQPPMTRPHQQYKKPAEDRVWQWVCCAKTDSSGRQCAPTEDNFRSEETVEARERQCMMTEASG
jgi:hypothetical protein